MNRPDWPWLAVFVLMFGLLVFLGITILKQMTSAASVIVSGGAKMVLVPAGPFMMGSDARAALAECRKISEADRCATEAFRDEEPAHMVTLDDFYIDVYEVTNGQYAECTRSGECDSPAASRSYTRESYFGDPRFEEFPVILVSWHDAQSYCRRRGARLPTEAEWEKAARGIDSRLYPWGDTISHGQANFCDRNCPYEWAAADYEDGYADTAPVGSFPEGVSPYGVHDMAGNVWEWVSDWYSADYYAGSPSENPAGPHSGEYRVARGGAWFSEPSSLRVTHRIANVPTAEYHLVGGFRCALSP